MTSKNLRGLQYQVTYGMGANKEVKGPLSNLNLSITVSAGDLT